MKWIILLFALCLFAHEGDQLYTKHGCYGCRGIDAKGGNGFPPLANKPKGYLVDRLKKYRSGSITSNRSDMMKPYAKNLSDKEIETIADYLAKLKSSDTNYYEEYDLSDAM